MGVECVHLPGFRFAASTTQFKGGLPPRLDSEKQGPVEGFEQCELGGLMCGAPEWVCACEVERGKGAVHIQVIARG